MRLIKKRVLIAMSGGVDSSVTAAILKEQGYECIGIHLQMWTDDAQGAQAQRSRNKCCTLDGLEDARLVASHLNIPFYVMNVVEQFKREVVDYFLGSYAIGQTPNPCIACNQTIKFGELLNRAKELGAAYVATGHYARIAYEEESGEYGLFAAVDGSKDQSYFLYHLNQEKLRHILFPLGDMKKSHVYELARKFRLPHVAEKPQSQGLCFFSDAKPKQFLKRALPPSYFKPGPIVTVDGRVIGTHGGLPLYTIGQRSGLGIGGLRGEPEGEPWYVVNINPLRNALVVGRRSDILSEKIACRDLNFISDSAQTSQTSQTAPLSITVRIRHRGELIPAMLEVRGGRGFIEFKKPACAAGAAAGQAAVFYEGEKVLGGGIIYNNDEYEKATRARGGISAAYRHDTAAEVES